MLKAFFQNFSAEYLMTFKVHSYFVIHIQFLGQSDIHSKVHKELQYTFAEME